MYGFLQGSYECAVSGEVPQSRQLQVYSLAQRETQPNNLRGTCDQTAPELQSQKRYQTVLTRAWEKLSKLA